MNIKIDTISQYAMIFPTSQYPYKYIYIYIYQYMIVNIPKISSSNIIYPPVN